MEEYEQKNYANWIWPILVALIMLFPTYEMLRMYWEIPSQEELVTVEGSLHDVSPGDVSTWFVFQLSDSFTRKGVFDGLNNELLLKYGDSYTIGDTFSLQYGSSAEQRLTGLRLREHTFFTLKEYEQSQIQAIREGPFLVFLFGLGAIVVFALVIALIPIMKRRSTARVKMKLMRIAGIVVKEPNVYHLRVHGYLVSFKHHLVMALQKYGNRNEIIARVEVPKEVSTKHYEKLVGRFDTEREGDQYYLLIRQNIHFYLNTNKLVAKVAQQVKALEEMST